MPLVYFLYRKLPCRYWFALTVLFFYCSLASAQDNCSAAININLPGGGFGTGLVTSSTTNISSATIQTDESFAPANDAAGQNQKSVWYKFSLPTSRSVLIRLAQNTPSMTSGDAGFAVYKTSACLPAITDLGTKLSPVTVFGSSSTNCLEAGNYLVQVVTKGTANGSVYLQIQTAAAATSPYDVTSEAFDFGNISRGISTINYRVECQTVDNASEVCSSLPNAVQYTKSTWHVFTTSSYFDYISLIFANQTLPAGQTYGLQVYKGDVRSGGASLMQGCSAIQSNSFKTAKKIFTCSDLEPNTTYSVQVFYHQSFTDNVQLSLSTAGTVSAAMPNPVLSSVHPNNTITLTPALGTYAGPQDYFGCNSRHSVTNCGPALPASGINYKGRNFNLSSFFTVTLSSAGTVKLNATPVCGPPLLLRLYHQNLTDNCADLDPANLIDESIGSSTLPSCLPAGSYIVQVSGSDSAIENTYAYGTISNSSTPLCLLSNFGNSFTLSISATAPVPVVQNIDSTICSGGSYTLSNGTIITIDGIYRDTLRNVNGCDSLVKILRLSFMQKTVNNVSATICSGGSYTLPSGKMVNNGGVYNDTLRYVSGCDSVINIITLSEKSTVKQAIDTSFCGAGSYILPSGKAVNMEGIYYDTVKYAGSGCDSLVSKVNLAVRKAAEQITTIKLCGGQAYTLPWGGIISRAGEYRDTLHYTTGCDSVIRIVQVSVTDLTEQKVLANICKGTSYTLPSGMIVNTPGIYRDTLRTPEGCDSLIRIVDLTVNNSIIEHRNAALCEGTFYTLPWGTVVTAEGDYRNTLPSVAGCDSLVLWVHVKRNTVIIKDSSITLCPGGQFISPAGTMIASGGSYKDTLRYTSGCDSIIYRMRVTEKTVTRNALSATICAGTFYTLPSGKTAAATGLYLDTVRSIEGCDSLITTVDLSAKETQTLSTTATICSGASYSLPWGRSVSGPGTYRDTLKYASGCDSLIREIIIQMLAPKTFSTNASVCRGDSYTLPWGTAVTAAGTYSDTLRTGAGCDSLVQTVNLSLAEKPVVSVTKSNDVDCILGSAKLVATGGSRYFWFPSVGLDRSDVPNPLAAPSVTTTYHVQVRSTAGCMAEDSMMVSVSTVASGESFLVPNAFTPNGDGLNDCFGIRHWGVVSGLHFSIYDRWGKLIFYTENPSECWNGSIRGAPLPSGTFIYAIRAKTNCGDVVRKGAFTLIR